MIHDQPSMFAGQSVRVISGPHEGKTYLVEDWWDRVAGRSWMVCDGNPACLNYACDAGDDPIDDEVLYGKFGGSGALIHVSRVAPPAGESDVA